MGLILSLSAGSSGFTSPTRCLLGHRPEGTAGPWKVKGKARKEAG